MNVAHGLSIHSKKATSNTDFYEPLSLEETKSQIAGLRAHQKIQSCEILFEFIHRTEEHLKPIRTQGILLLAHENHTIFKRLVLIDEQGDVLVDYIFHESDLSQVWKRWGSQNSFTLINDEQLFLPIYDNILFRPVDVLMPYIYWEEYSYEGPHTLGIHSVVHNYLLSAKNAPEFLSNGISSVRLSIDSKYNSLRKIEYLDKDYVLNELHISGVKKFNDLWLISRLVFKEKNNKTIFKVKEASVFSEKNIYDFFDPSNEKKQGLNLFLDRHKTKSLP